MKRPVIALVLLSSVIGCRNPAGSEPAPDKAPTTVVQPDGDASADQAFWKWFVANEARLRKAAAQDAAEVVRTDPMNAELKKVHPSLLFELTSRDDGKDELVISADGDSSAFGAVEKLVAAAPSVTGWHVTAFRQRASELDFSIEFGDVSLSPQVVFFRSADEGLKLGLTIYLPEGMDGQDQPKMVTFLLLDHVLGEYDVETRIGSIDWKPLPKDTAGLRPLEDLRTAVDEHKRAK